MVECTVILLKSELEVGEMIGKLSMVESSDTIIETVHTEAQAIKAQFPHIIKAVIVALTMISLVLSGAVVVAYFTDTSLDQLTRDPASATRTQFYIGFVSNIGLMVWAGTVATCTLASRLLWRTDQHSQAHFFLASAGISLMLLLDDAFLLHENVIPQIFHVPEIAVYVVYGMLIVSYLIYFRNDIFGTDYTLLIMALSGFGFSLFIDFFDTDTIVYTFLEDAFKFTGIVLWLTYYMHTAYKSLRERLLANSE